MNNLPRRPETARSFSFMPPAVLCLLALSAGLFYTACPQIADFGSSS